MKYYKDKNGDVRAFPQDGSQDSFIDESYSLITGDELDRIINADKYLTDEQKEAERLKQFTLLTPRQFKLALLENDLLETVESQINQIADTKLKARIQIEYSEAEKFERQSESVIYMINLLKLNNEQVDQMWIYAMSL